LPAQKLAFWPIARAHRCRKPLRFLSLKTIAIGAFALGLDRKLVGRQIRNRSLT